MSETLPIGLTYLSPVGNYGRQNTQALGGVSHLWQDFFARALAEQQGAESDPVSQAIAQQIDKDSGEPLGGVRTLAQIHVQRSCDVHDSEIKPPEPLFSSTLRLWLKVLAVARSMWPSPFRSAATTDAG